MNVVNIIIAVLIILSFFWFAKAMYSTEPPTVRVDYTKFLRYVDKGLVSDVSISDDGSVKFHLKGDRRYYEIYAPWIEKDSDLLKKLAEKGVKVSGEKTISSSVWVNILGTLIPTLLLIFVWIFVMRAIASRGNNAMTFTRSRARMFKPGEKRVTFKDVAGVDEAVEELQEVVDFLKNPLKYNRIGARMPKGILLVGPPGTGKTLLARAVAGEANVPFFHISGSDFVELFVGVGAARVRDLFNQAKSNAPCIVFIDEIDAVGRHRGAGLGGGHDEREQTLNQLLVEMDGFDSKEGIIVMAATNRPDILDPALLRPGRFDKKVVVDPPDIRGREEILKIHMRGKPISDDVDVKILAKRTTGFVGADLENLINEAALLAAREGRSVISMKDFEEAIDRVIAGPARKSRVISQKEKEIIAYHEVGHAIVSTVLPNADPVHRISIIPRGYKALGYTLQLPHEDKYLISKQEMLDKISTMLGGRAAEEIVFGDITSGAANDIERATEMARAMVCELGMSERLGPLSWGKTEKEVFLGKDLARIRNFSEEVASEIDEEVKNIVTKCYNRAKEILRNHRHQMDRIVEILLEKETIEGDELREILNSELKDREIEDSRVDQEVDN